MMTLCEQLILVSDSYISEKKITRSVLSNRVFRRGNKLDRIDHGLEDLNTKTWENAMLYLSREWPANLHWPEDIPRPYFHRVIDDA